MVISSRAQTFSRLEACLRESSASHLTCTPSAFSTIMCNPAGLPALQVVALGGEVMPRQLIKRWAPAAVGGGSGVRTPAVTNDRWCDGPRTCAFLMGVRYTIAPSWIQSVRDVASRLVVKIIALCACRAVAAHSGQAQQ